MTISLVVIQYLNEEYFGDLLNSILRNELSIDDKFEVVIIDSSLGMEPKNSDKTSKEIVDEFIEKSSSNKSISNIVYKQIKDQGILYARKLGVKLSSGDYVTFIDGDDIIFENSIKDIILDIKNNNYPDIVEAPTYNFYDYCREHEKNEKLVNTYNYYSLLRCGFLEKMLLIGLNIYQRTYIRPGLVSLNANETLFSFFEIIRNWSLWSKFIKRNIVDKMMNMQKDDVNECVISEDLYQAFILYTIAKSYFGSTNKFYNYRLHVDSSAGATRYANSYFNFINGINHEIPKEIVNDRYKTINNRNNYNQVILHRLLYLYMCDILDNDSAIYNNKHALNNARIAYFIIFEETNFLELTSYFLRTKSDFNKNMFDDNKSFNFVYGESLIKRNSDLFGDKSILNIGNNVLQDSAITQKTLLNVQLSPHCQAMNSIYLTYNSETDNVEFDRCCLCKQYPYALKGNTGFVRNLKISRTEFMKIKDINAFLVDICMKNNSCVDDCVYNFNRDYKKYDPKNPFLVESRKNKIRYVCPPCLGEISDVHLSFSRACNAHCTYCMCDNMTENSHRDSKERKELYFHTLHNLMKNTKCIHLTDYGEPFFYKQEILDWINSKQPDDKFVDMRAISNGLLLTSDYVDKLDKALCDHDIKLELRFTIDDKDLNEDKFFSTRQYSLQTVLDNAKYIINNCKNITLKYMYIYTGNDKYDISMHMSIDETGKNDLYNNLKSLNLIDPKAEAKRNDYVTESEYLWDLISSGTVYDYSDCNLFKGMKV